MQTQEQLVERWRSWSRSIEQRDVEAAAGHLADDYALELVQPQRTVVPREEWLRTLPDYVVSEYTVEDQIVNVDGDVGVILHRARMKAVVQGTDRSGVFVITDVWRYRDGAWRVWRRHSTPLSAGALPSSRSA
jgi:ketosteroid isomerase-like protein